MMIDEEILNKKLYESVIIKCHNTTNKLIKFSWKSKYNMIYTIPQTYYTLFKILANIIAHKSDDEW